MLERIGDYEAICRNMPSEDENDKDDTSESSE